jgi:hypothetical protein
MPSPNPTLRQQVIRVYKGAHNILHSPQTQHSNPITPELLFMGREYPKGYDYYRTRLHKAFISQAHLDDEEAIRNGIKRAEFVKKGIKLPFTKQAKNLLMSFLRDGSTVRKGFSRHGYFQLTTARYYLKRYRTLRQRYDPIK